MIRRHPKYTRTDPLFPNPPLSRSNIALAEAACRIPHRDPATEDLFKAPTPSAPKCEIVAQQLNKPLSDTVKSIVLATENADAPGQARVWLLLLRGDHELNEIKISKLAGFEGGHSFATDNEIISESRRVGNEGVSTCKTGNLPD